MSQVLDALKRLISAIIAFLRKKFARWRPTSNVSRYNPSNQRSVPSFVGTAALHVSMNPYLVVTQNVVVPASNSLRNLPRNGRARLLETLTQVNLGEYDVIEEQPLEESDFAMTTTQFCKPFREVSCADSHFKGGGDNKDEGKGHSSGHCSASVVQVSQPHSLLDSLDLLDSTADQSSSGGEHKDSSHWLTVKPGTDSGSHSIPNTSSNPLPDSSSDLLESSTSAGVSVELHKVSSSPEYLFHNLTLESYYSYPRTNLYPPFSCPN